MGKADKLLEKFLNSKKTFEWDELVVLFSSLGYVKKEMQGSRVRFFNAEINHTILMHRPHPESYIKSYIKGGTLKAIKQNLKEAGVL
ncbi:TPA: type II toxin-antitoxin system HicA family toxin [Escherichia coli]|nr:type II toxin-antitoxin system HicA family toxin [Escherichia coli]HDX3867503.1 type II toxin-antitoxin system HicA family toxin [Escherichia coli]HEA8325992.1 type II toxin-antitoxin system HicA family toxin [Escherichia coli]HEA8451572.1 type II toxin-antitoxin system HicA family toxin [Escherichia coli]HEA8550818.1 type II toxin-antitoxin system HicA family toxin [Escherichia coli]